MGVSVMKLISGAVAGALWCFAATALADPGAGPEPMQQAEDILQQNIKNQPENKGLEGALRQVRKNIRRFESKHTDKASARPDRNQAKGGGIRDVDATVRAERNDRPERVERFERVERVEHPERVERVDAQVVIDRPGNSDFGHSHRR